MTIVINGKSNNLNTGQQTPSNGSRPSVQFVVAKEMWIYVVTTVPILLLTLATYMWYERKVQREQRLHLISE